MSKHSEIMVNLLFQGSKSSDTQEHTLKVFANTNYEIYIEIETLGYGEQSFIVLDRETAIKLSKELRKQISKIHF